MKTMFMKASLESAPEKLVLLLLLILGSAWIGSSRADQLSLEIAPPVVIKTEPVAGSTAVSPSLTEVRVTFSKEMQDGGWSWSTWGQENFPKTTGRPHYLEDHRTCVLPVKLEPGKFYATWLNSSKFTNFRDASGKSAVPYLLTFQTSGTRAEAGPAEATPAKAEDGVPGESGVRAAAAAAVAAANVIPGGPLNEDQLAVLKWTEVSFRGFFDHRSFENWSEADRAALEARLLDTLKGPQNREYYEAINSLAAMRSKAAVQPLLAIATDRAEKDCRDRWMAVRALGLIGDQSVVPELAHLVYHGNANTRWWAQISLVRLTQVNYGADVDAWGTWWNNQGKPPAFSRERIVWNHAPEYSDPEKLSKVLTDSDQRFISSLKSKGF